jgi:hypothetical protein
MKAAREAQRRGYITPAEVVAIEEEVGTHA